MNGITTQLHELLAVLQSKKSSSSKAFEEITNQFSKHSDRYDGMVRTYQPVKDDDEVLPPESKELGDRVTEKLDFVMEIFRDYFDVAMQIETTNQTARADIVVDGEAILFEIPATGLLFLEKQFKAIRTIINRVPTLDPAERWHWDEDNQVHTSEESKTVRPKKIFRNHVVSKATKEHPEQVQVYTEDVTIGTWTKKRFSGKITVFEKSQLMARVDKLINAIVQARQRANSVVISPINVGDVLWSWLKTPLVK
jgi:hypothetical protein